jgi:rSAM/selenodomain-associated transferase 1
MGYRPQTRPLADKTQAHSKTDSRSPIAPSHSAAQAALIIFAKAPIPGQVKTRLCPPLTGDEAATLHGSMVLDVLERTRPSTGSGPRAQPRGASGWDRFLACAPSAQHVFFRIMEERYQVSLFSQAGDDLGVRMHDAFRTVFELGYHKAVLIGTDVPSLSSRLVAQALASLSTHDVVLGPALDGGYYLIGLTHPQPDLFAGLPWSSDRVCALTQEKARALQLSLELLPPQRDLDTVEDVLAIVQDLQALSARTAGVLRSLAERIRARNSTEGTKPTP